MTAQVGGTATVTAPAADAAPAPMTDPQEEAIRAIEQTRQYLAEASAAVLSGDDEQIAHAYELAAGCTDFIAKALWFLRRTEREREARG